VISSSTTSPSAAGTPSSGANAEFRVIDVGSLTGTYVNREPVDSAVLANGDELQIGKFRLMFLSGPTTDGTESEGS
jgi:pSer/pThr/pTyr-binding forkhead associated (FHA) protein